MADAGGARRWWRQWTVLLATLVAILIVSGAFLVVDRLDLEAPPRRTLTEDVFDAVEADAALNVVPPEAASAIRHRREVCFDRSGDMPSSWREFRTPVADESVIDFFVEAMPTHGWELARRWAGGGHVLASGASFSKFFAHREVELVVYAMVADDVVVVNARIPCGRRRVPIERDAQ